ncbi:hypothetical protein OIU79_017045 [Salix purpurea]|uniref:Uncharacterized protein n=1 Tax=Salix purpurea TaxID=77065 RepID=A0A9Q0WU01_SALPP|nr:hypothetical protein OIU79_017045 [Salix purpurea]
MLVLRWITMIGEALSIHWLAQRAVRESTFPISYEGHGLKLERTRALCFIFICVEEIINTVLYSAEFLYLCA